ncbi:MAG TPA: hypothetical protein PLX23_06805, partial [Candidatus Hydrogenedens sp.]|nr:hypothetical protein [Candidatus Hydrogenedens sp.]
MLHLLLFILLGILSANNDTETRWVNPSVELLEVNRNGPFIALEDGSIATIGAEGFRVSKDEGKTWTEPNPVCKGLDPEEPASYYLLKTKNNVLVFVYLNFIGKKFEWDEKRKEPKEGCKLEVWA